MYGVPAAEWWDNWAGLARAAWQVQGPTFAWPLLLSVGAAVGVVVGLAIPSLRRHLGNLWAAAAILAVAASADFAFMGTRYWVQFNLYHYRYCMPPLLLLQVAAVALFLSPLYHRVVLRAIPYWRTGMLLFAGLVLCSAAWLGYGSPSLAGVESDLKARFGGPQCDEIINNHCTHMAGDYWLVWRTVFYVNMVRFEQGDRDALWGVTFRGHPTARRWRNLPKGQMRIAMDPNDQANGQRYLKEFGLDPSEVVERHSTIWVLRPAPTCPGPQR
jgi:hypothetical protein